MIGLLKPAAFVPELPAERIDPEYRRLRRRVYAGIFVGYAGYYLVRNNLALAIPDLLAEHPGYSKAALGTALTALSIAYGLSKFLMGSVSDRSNPKYFLPLGLLLSCALMAAFGLVEALSASLVAIIVVMAANGWVQGMGWPPCGKTMVHWFSVRERGLTVSTWNVAHNVGGALVANLALAGVILFNDWGAKFYFNAAIAAAIAIGIFFLVEDTPQSRGLPPVERWRNDYPESYSEASETTLPFREIFLKYVLPNRLAVGDRDRERFLLLRALWRRELDTDLPRDGEGILLPPVEHGLGAVRVRGDPRDDPLRMAFRPLVQGRRAPMTMIFMALTLVAVVVYWMNLRGPLWIDYVALFAIGFLIYGPIMMIGLHSLDLVPKKAAGTAAGLTGFFGYVFGSAIAGTGVGWIADRWDWNGVFITMVACCLLTIFFMSLTLGHRATSAAR